MSFTVPVSFSPVLRFGGVSGMIRPIYAITSSWLIRSAETRREMDAMKRRDGELSMMGAWLSAQKANQVFTVFLAEITFFGCGKKCHLFIFIALLYINAVINAVCFEHKFGYPFSE